MHNVTSPNTSDESVEQEIQRKGKTAPRITPDDIETNIAHVSFFTAGQGALQNAIFREADDAQEYHASLDLLTICVITLANGFTVTGTSACASPENYDREIGERIARANAVQQIWSLMGYELKQRLHEQERRAARYSGNDHADWQLRVCFERDDLCEKLDALDKFSATDAFDALEDRQKSDLFEQAEVMKNYAAILTRRIAAF
jgi:hypothetical protein